VQSQPKSWFRQAVLALALAFVVALSWSLRRTSPQRVDCLFRLVQLGSAAAYSLGHGTNDAQKTMGIIAALLYASIWHHQQEAFLAGTVAFPFWIVLVCHLAIGLGTLAGGRRIIKTMADDTYKAPAVPGGVRGSRSSYLILRDIRAGHSRQHHAYDRRCDCRRRRCPEALGGPLGHCAFGRLGLDSHHPRLRADGGDRL
jgi:hypothetical protein